MKRQLLAYFILIITASAVLAADTNSVAPKVFAGWQLEKSDVVRDPAQADPLYADLLKEYGFAEVHAAQYTKPGRSLRVKIARFNDATGAYGAYSFYRSPEMAPEKIGDMAASNNERILFLSSNLLVDVRLDRVTPMTAGELRELASVLPKQTGHTANLPTVTAYLPRQGIIPNSTRYVSGPIALARLQGSLPPEQVDFSTGAEIGSAQYNTGKGTASLTLISYPTPAIAGMRARSIEQWRPPTESGPGSAWTKRSGPLVAIVTGSISESEAKSLLASVNYDADVTWSQDTGTNKRNNIGNLLVNIIILIGVILGLALVAGIAFGGLRILVKRMFPDRVFDRQEDVEIIRLNIGKLE